jgi:NTE family protein
MKLGVVLGGGGTVGIAYHLGVLHALEREAGISVVDAEVVVGTSAGSVVGAYLRCGWSIERLWSEVIGASAGGVECDADAGDPAAVPYAVAGATPEGRPIPKVMVPAYEGPLELLRRGLGSAYVLGRCVWRVPAPALPSVLRRSFPSGLFEMADGRKRLEDDLAELWPGPPPWLCALDIASGRRVVLGRDVGSDMSPADAVRASCAIPGVYEPITAGRRVLVDGGVHSSTNLDLVARAGCDAVIAVAPLAFDPRRPPGPLGLAVRNPATAMLAAEAALVRRRGTGVVLVRPCRDQIRLHGRNLMRSTGLERVAEAAYETTRRQVRRGALLRPLDSAA